MTVAWIVGLVGVVGLASAGRLAESSVRDAETGVVPPATPPVAATTPPATPPVAATTSTAAALAIDEAWSSDGGLIVVTSPAEGRPTITAVELIVQGFLQDDAASLLVVLETGTYELDVAQVVPALAFGERPGATRHPQFLVRFGLPDPRPVGPMAVRVVAFDADGERLDAVRRLFRLGPLSRPTLGDDGLIGGLVFGAS